jgi:Fe-S cluster assembly protein SufD
MTTAGQLSFANVNNYVSASEMLEQDGAQWDPSWARSLRKDSLARFKELGFPTARRENEEWKYTDISPIARIPFEIVLTTNTKHITDNDVLKFTLNNASCNKMVFVDGQFAAHLSSISSLPEGAYVTNLADAMKKQIPAAKNNLAQHALYSDSAFIALNTAFLHHGAFLYIPDGAFVADPIHVLYLFNTHERERAFHPRMLVVTGKNSNLTVIEHYAGLGNNTYLSNSVTEVALGAGSNMEHYRIQQHSSQAFHVGTTQVTLHRDSTYTSVVSDMGGGLTRNNLNVLTADEGASCTLNGVYILDGSQHVDNQVIIDHASPHTNSHELYKGILDDESRSVFHGSIIVRENCPKVDARQVDKNLLLSDRAEADTKPAFWIYTDDVKCAHGASCGKIDETAMFYLRSRGISEKAARGMLSRAFVVEVIESVPNLAVRTYMDELARTKLNVMLGDENT